MDKSKQEKLIRLLRDRIVKQYKPKKVVLFGSRAYGTSTPKSDFDLFIIKETRKHAIERSIEVSRLFPDRDFALDIIVRTPSEVRRRLQWGDFFYKSVLTKGRVLYEKP